MNAAAHNDPASSGWHLDRRVPIALIVTLMVQFGAGVWFVSSLSKDVGANRDGIAELKTEFRNLKIGRDDLTSRVIRIEERLNNQTEILKDIRRAVVPNGN